MTDSTAQKKSQQFWGEAETNAMLGFLREIDIMKFLGKLENKNSKGETVATCSTVVLLLLFDFRFQVKSHESIGRMTWGGCASCESLIRLCSVTCKREYKWNINNSRKHLN